MNTSATAHWLGLVATQPGAGFYVRWRTHARSAESHPPVLAVLRVGDHPCGAPDVAELDGVVIEQPLRPLEVEVIPNGVVRFTLPAGALGATSPEITHPLDVRLAFVAPDGTSAVEGEDYELLRVPSLRAVVVEDAEARSFPDADDEG